MGASAGGGTSGVSRTSGASGSGGASSTSATGATSGSTASRIDATFAALKAADRRALIPFITAGDPSPRATVPIMHALVEGGADVIELGVPFSDPMADGPVVQRSSERALAQGTRLRDVLDMTSEFRKTNSTTPVVFMGYANPIEAMGEAVFVNAAKDAGVDGVLVVDYPPEEVGDFAALLTSNGLAPIFLLSPTTPSSRIASVARLARGYVYYVSLRGITGAANIDVADVAEKLAHIRKYVTIPIGVGFGIRDAASARAVGACADAVIIGSALVQAIADAGEKDAPAKARAWLAMIRSALDAR